MFSFRLYGLSKISAITNIGRYFTKTKASGADSWYIDENVNLVISVRF